MAVIFVTGSSGLVGSAVADYFCERGHAVHGIDNNMRRIFFGSEGDTEQTRIWLEQRHKSSYKHHYADIRNRQEVASLLAYFKPKLLVHAAGQPSHDFAATNPFGDWDVNATGTINLLEGVRQWVPECVFVYMSTNKVYGDSPNRIQLTERVKRIDYADPLRWEGIDETMSIDQSLHSLFGVSKAAADLMVQEYGRYFNMRTCCLRCGCMTGPHHAGVELHGFLNYLVKCNVLERVYKIFGHKGKQVRDNIHATDVARFIDAFWSNPRIGEVYNLGGGKPNSCSILEAIDLVQAISGKPMLYEYVPQGRKGDHLCYYTSLRKAWRHYPDWEIKLPLKETIKEIHDHYARTSACNSDLPGGEPLQLQSVGSAQPDPGSDHPSK